jgi:shikimate kinase
MNVVLVGYRGTGKSAVAKILAQELALQLVCLDAELERAAGMTIPDFVAARGWSEFRDLEEQLVRKFSALDGQVLDCGGGVIEREANYQPLRLAGPVIWLKASVETIVARIGGDDQRPSLTGTKSFTEEVAEVLARRTPLYQRIAHYPVETDNRGIQDVAEEVQRLLQR